MRLLRALSLALSATLLTACVTAPSSRVLPPVPEYTRAIMDRAVLEIQGDPRPLCEKDAGPEEDCSAIKRLIVDYGDLRRQLKALEDAQ